MMLPVTPYVTSDPEKATPYLATNASKVTQWQDAYPVYVKYDVSYTTTCTARALTELMGLTYPTGISSPR